MNHHYNHHSPIMDVNIHLGILGALRRRSFDVRLMPSMARVNEEPELRRCSLDEDLMSLTLVVPQNYRRKVGLEIKPSLCPLYMEVDMNVIFQAVSFVMWEL